MRCRMNLCGHVFPAVLVPLLLAACSGGGGGGDGDGQAATDEPEPVFAVGYPSPNANLAGPETTTVVRGRVFDANGGVITAGDVLFIDVNSNYATFEVGDPTRWSVEVPVGEGATTLDVTMARADGSTQQGSQLVFNQARFSGPSALVYDSVNSRVIATDQDLDSVMLADLATGGLSTISDGSTVAPLLPFPIGLAYDAANDRALVVDLGQAHLVAVDVTTGVRTVVSDNSGSHGTGTHFTNPFGVGYDATHDPDNAVVYDKGNEMLFQVDLATGNRTVVPTNDDGNGPDLGRVAGFHYDGANARVLLSVDDVNNTLLTIDLVDGTREIVSSGSVGLGTTFNAPGGVTYDGDNDRALVIDYSLRALLAVDMSTGNRSVISDNGDDYTGVEISSEAFYLVHDGVNNRVLYTDRDPDAVVALDLASGNRTILVDGRTSTGTGFTRPGGAVLDTADNRVLVADAGADAVVAVDLDSGNRETLSANPAVGSGMLFGDLLRIGYDSDNDRALVTDLSYDGLFVVDLATGDRTLVTENGDDNGADFIMDPTAVVYEPGTGSALVVDQGAFGVDPDADALLFRVDLATGARSIVSDNSGEYSGPDFVEPTGIALDEAGGRAFVIDAGSRALLEIDLVTGDRSTIADNTYGGTDFSDPVDVVYDRDNDRALVLDNSLKALLDVDLVTGHRTVLSDDADPGPDYGILTGMAGGGVQDRVFITDETNALLIVDLPSGARAIASR